MSLLEVEKLVKQFPVRRRRGARFSAVCGISLEVKQGETLALVGESGSGKTTAARTLMRLLEPTSGSVRFEGLDVTKATTAELRNMRPRLQIVFQDPYRSLNPRRSVLATLRESARRQRAKYPDDVVEEVLDLVGLDASFANRFPHELSGGQRQRVAIARALACNPSLLVLDEPVTALDVSLRTGIIGMLARVQKAKGLSYLLIAHDLEVVRSLAHRIAVMYLGRIVETAACEDIFAGPAHPYTQALLSAVPIPDPKKERERERFVLVGEPPSPLHPPSGCVFRTRCARAQDRCAAEVPELGGDGHEVACFFPG